MSNEQHPALDFTCCDGGLDVKDDSVDSASRLQKVAGGWIGGGGGGCMWPQPKHIYIP